jgi:hypothetical protein
MGSRTYVFGIGGERLQNDARIHGLSAAEKHPEFVRPSCEDLNLGGLEIWDSESACAGEFLDVKQVCAPPRYRAKILYPAECHFFETRHYIR